MIFDGRVEAARSLSIDQDNGDDRVHEIAGIAVMKANPISVSAEVTLASCWDRAYDSVHFVLDDELYILEDVVVDSHERTMGEDWVQIHLSAKEMSVRPLSHKT